MNKPFRAACRDRRFSVLINAMDSFSERAISVSITDWRATIPYSASNTNRRAGLHTRRFRKNEHICSRNLKATFDSFISRTFRTGLVLRVSTTLNHPPKGPLFHPEIPPSDIPQKIAPNARKPASVLTTTDPGSGNAALRKKMGKLQLSVILDLRPLVSTIRKRETAQVQIGKETSGCEVREDDVTALP